MTRLLIIAATIAGGIVIDARGGAYGQLVSDLIAWAAVAAVWLRSDPEFRRRAVVCLAVSTLGELFLLDVWGIYAYRAGHLPLFVPAGHVLVFAAAMDWSDRMPAWLPAALVAALAPYVAWALVADVDRQAAIWFGALVALVVLSHTRRLYAALFLVALAIEATGVWLGSWRYAAHDPWLGLSTTNPPMCAGGIYCVSIAIVLGIDRLGRTTRRVGDLVIVDRLGDRAMSDFCNHQINHHIENRRSSQIDNLQRLETRRCRAVEP